MKQMTQKDLQNVRRLFSERFSLSELMTIILIISCCKSINIIVYRLAYRSVSKSLQEQRFSIPNYMYRHRRLCRNNV